MMGQLTEAELCESVQNRCVSRLGCSAALNSYWISCGKLLHGETTECSKQCIQSLISLLISDDQEGQNLMQCDCNGNEYCDTHKRRLRVCSKDVLRWINIVNDPHTRISCSLAELICRADSPCLTALTYYEDHCQKLWRGERCTPRCNNSINILYRRPRAEKLRSCICDGTEGYNVPCDVIQQHTERLCFPPHRRRHGGKHNHNSSNIDRNVHTGEPCGHSDAGCRIAETLDVKPPESHSSALSRHWWTLPLLLWLFFLLR